MKRFLVKITLSGGYQANIRVTAENADSAIRRIENQLNLSTSLKGVKSSKSNLRKFQLSLSRRITTYYNHRRQKAGG